MLFKLLYFTLHLNLLLNLVIKLNFAAKNEKEECTFFNLIINTVDSQLSNTHGTKDILDKQEDIIRSIFLIAQ